MTLSSEMMDIIRQMSEDARADFLTSDDGLSAIVANARKLTELSNGQREFNAYDAYNLRDGLTVSELSRITNIPRSTIYYRMRKNGIERNNRRISLSDVDEIMTGTRHTSKKQNKTNMSDSQSNNTDDREHTFRDKMVHYNDVANGFGYETLSDWLLATSKGDGRFPELAIFVLTNTDILQVYISVKSIIDYAKTIYTGTHLRDALNILYGL